MFKMYCLYLLITYFKFPEKDILLRVEVQLLSLKQLRVGDDVKILFYKGSGDVDVVQQEIIETVKDRR